MSTQLKTRAEGLVSRKRYAEAADEYRTLANQASPEERPTHAIGLGGCSASQSARNRDAKQVLASVGNVSGELNAQRLYLLGQVAWAANDNDTFYRTVDELRQADADQSVAGASAALRR